MERFPKGITPHASSSIVENALGTIREVPGPLEQLARIGEIQVGLELERAQIVYKIASEKRIAANEGPFNTEVVNSEVRYWTEEANRLALSNNETLAL
jgi:hypothetical protein